MNALIKLTPDEIAKIVVDHLEAKGMKAVSDVTFEHGSRLSGYGPMESLTPYFDGCRVSVEVEPKRSEGQSNE